MNTAQKSTIVLAGGSGFLGTALARFFSQGGHAVKVLTRRRIRSKPDIAFVPWDGRSPGAWIDHLEGAAALINLAGQSVDCRYHARNQRLILDSRIDSTRILGRAVAQCRKPPPIWINSSTATIYRHTFGDAWGEAGEIGETPEAKDQFSVAVASAWEEEFFKSQAPGVRKIALRSAMVLGAGRNSVFPVLRRLTRLGLGGPMGSGRQFVSWIHEADFCRAIAWLIARPDIDGPVNLAAPSPLPNHEMMRALRRICGAPFGFGLPAPQWLLELGAFLLRTETELIIKSRRVRPGRLAAGGFRFSFDRFEDAAIDLESQDAANNL